MAKKTMTVLFVNGPFDDQFAEVPMDKLRHTISVKDGSGEEHQYVFTKLEDFESGNHPMYIYKEWEKF